MHNQINFEVINSFATKMYGGNPAGVIHYIKDQLSTLDMQRIAKQLNLVETVFVTENSNSNYNFELKYFTPLKELPIAGHPTIAAWVSIINNFTYIKSGEYFQKTLKGIQKIEIERDPELVIWMQQSEPHFISIEESISEIANIFSISVSDIISGSILGVDTGLGHLIFEVNSLKSLNNIKRNIELLKIICNKYNLNEAQIFCKETYDNSNNIHTRNICPRDGIEDPACGVGSGALLAYILKKMDIHELHLSIEQGNIIDMPSVILASGKKDGEKYSIKIGGAGVKMIEGKIYY
jgi:trans-2,3-dihydro-3-hydroxyanthranilate isomerase